MKDAPWFRHDSTAASDPKTAALILRHGMAGYGRWWRLVEMLRNEEDYCLPVGPRTTACLAEAWKCSPVKAQEFLDYLASSEIELIATDGKCYWSNSLCRRMENLEKVKEVRRSAGKEGAKKRWQTHSKPIANAIPDKPKRGISKIPNAMANDSNGLIERETLVSLSLSDTPSIAPDDGACGAPDGAAAPPGPHPRAAVEDLAKRGDRWAQDWIRDHPDPVRAGNSRAAPPISPATEKDDVFADDETGGTP